MAPEEKEAYYKIIDRQFATLSAIDEPPNLVKNLATTLRIYKHYLSSPKERFAILVEDPDAKGRYFIYNGKDETGKDIERKFRFLTQDEMEELLSIDTNILRERQETRWIRNEGILPPEKKESFEDIPEDPDIAAARILKFGHRYTAQAK